MLDIHFESFPTLTTRRLILREIFASDAEILFDLRSHPDVIKYLDRDGDKDVYEVDALIQQLNQSLVEGDGVHWGISFRDGNDEIVGVLSFWRIDKKNHRGELGYMLHPNFWRQGIMHEAIHAVLDYGFRRMRLHSVEANTSAGNGASQALLLKCGFVQEAHFRENWYYDGVFSDSLIFCKLASD